MKKYLFEVLVYPIKNPLPYPKKYHVLADTHTSAVRLVSESFNEQVWKTESKSLCPAEEIIAQKD